MVIWLVFIGYLTTDSLNLVRDVRMGEVEEKGEREKGNEHRRWLVIPDYQIAGLGRE